MSAWSSQRPGDPVIGGPWNDGRLPVPTPSVHRFASFDDMGLAIAVCGLRQEHRSNGWAVIMNPYQRKMITDGVWLPCQECQGA